MSSYVNTYSTEAQYPALRSTALVILSSILIGLFANVAIPLPFTPIPLATQGQLILIVSVLLGAKRAVAATLGFLAQGAIGLPVFAGGVGGGIAKFLGPTGGYLFGYLVAAFLVGYLSERVRSKTPLQYFLIMAAGNGMFFLFGVPYLASFIGFKQALLQGLLPFLLVDVFKLCMSAKMVGWIQRKR
ncbi:MAG: biotin transporter BioY [Chlamydiia bacterium]|nr:biotin transporter BioY [Chlamydiia bacterium]